jgi:predicted RNA-binding Zn-ribbon protein involved in translation (DUF1610 family)
MKCNKCGAGEMAPKYDDHEWDMACPNCGTAMKRGEHVTHVTNKTQPMAYMGVSVYEHFRNGDKPDEYRVRCSWMSSIGEYHIQQFDARELNCGATP